MGSRVHVLGGESFRIGFVDVRGVECDLAEFLASFE